MACNNMMLNLTNPLSRVPAGTHSGLWSPKIETLLTKYSSSRFCLQGKLSHNRTESGDKMDFHGCDSGFSC